MNKNLLKTVLKIHFLMRRKSQRTFLGSYRSVFKGSGLTFSDFREYCAGDDVRSVSWTLTAKIGKPYIKVFEEDRGSTFILMIDVSASSFFGTKNQTKKDVIQQLATLIALFAEKNQDQLSVLLFSSQVEKYIPPSKGRNHTLNMIQQIYSHQPCFKGTDFKEPCQHLSRVLKKKCYVFILSDFVAPTSKLYLSRLSHRHDVTGIIVQDPLEEKLPSLGLMDLQDMESGMSRVVDTSDFVFQKVYKEKLQEVKRDKEKMLKQAGIDYFYVSTHGDIFKPFIQFMQKKSRMKMC